MPSHTDREFLCLSKQLFSVLQWRVPSKPAPTICSNLENVTVSMVERIRTISSSWENKDSALKNQPEGLCCFHERNDVFYADFRFMKREIVRLPTDARAQNVRCR